LWDEQCESILIRVLGIYRRLPRDIYVLFVAQIVNSIGNFVYPFLALLLTEKGDFSTAEAGRIIMVAATGFIPGSLLGGKFADVFGRKRMIVVGFLLVSVSFITCGFINNMRLLPWFVIVAEFAMGMIHPTIQALTTDLTTPQNRKAAFSLTYLGHNIGFAVGPLIAGYLFTHNTRLMFFGDAGTSILAVVLLAFLVRESRPDKAELERIEREQPAERAESGGIIGVLLRRPALVLFMLATLISSFVYAQYTFALPLFLRDTLGDRGPQVYGVVMTTNALIVVFGTAPLIALTHGRRAVTNVGLSAVLYAIGFGALYFCGGIACVIGLTVIWTAGEILAATNVDVYVANHTPAGHRGRMNAISPILTGLGFAVSPMVIGSFIERFSSRSVWPLAGLLAVVAAVGFLLLRIFDRRQTA